MDHGNPVVAAIYGRLCQLLRVDASHGERMQGQRYETSQRFKPHHDFIRTDRPNWKIQKKMGGQRTWTAMIFLNEPVAGGCTGFPLADLSFTPRRGTLLAWNNLLPDNSPNEFSLHEGCAVEAGAKYLVTQWFRERPCKLPGPRAAMRRTALRFLSMLRKSRPDLG
jgi:prolyl 4-hydroxylase